MAKAIPDGFNSISAHVVVRGAAKAMEFYKKAFGAEEVMRMPGPDGQSVMHGEVRIGNSTLMLVDENPQMGCKSAQTFGGTPVTLHLYVADADAAFKRAVAAGAEVRMPISDMFWGDRYGQVADPFGLTWSIAQHVKDLTPEQIGKAAQEFFASMGGKCGS